MKKPLAIFIADLHLRDSVPLCRTDDFKKAQWDKIKFLEDTYFRLECPSIICAGDLFHENTKRIKPSPWLLQMALNYLPPMYVIPGNHDLPNHSLDLLDQSGLSVLKAGSSDCIKLITEPLSKIETDNGLKICGIPYGIPYTEEMKKAKGDILILHEMVWKTNPPWPNAKGYSAKEISNMFPGFKVIVVGHNHEFMIKENVVNPGPLMRSKVTEANYEPRMVLWYGNLDFEEKKFPIEFRVVSKKHIIKRDEQDNRMHVFVESLSKEVDLGLDFVENLKQNIDKNKIDQGVVDILFEECLEI
ncbi:MAG: metallophosphoesterase family protein [Candidatus Heimdallarchaeaceae archaeon]